MLIYRRMSVPFGQHLKKINRICPLPLNVPYVSYIITQPKQNNSSHLEYNNQIYNISPTIQNILNRVEDHAKQEILTINTNSTIINGSEENKDTVSKDNSRINIINSDEKQDVFLSNPHFLYSGLTGSDITKAVHYWIPEDPTECFVAEHYIKNNSAGRWGTVHGGLLATLMDDMLGTVIHSKSDKKRLTADLRISYKRPVHSSALVYVLGYIVSIKDRKATARSYIVQEIDGKLEICAESESLFISPRQ